MENGAATTVLEFHVEHAAGSVCEANIAALRRAVPDVELTHVHAATPAGSCILVVRPPASASVVARHLAEIAPEASVTPWVRGGTPSTSPTRSAPPRWKSFLMVLGALYPLLVLAEVTLGPLVRDLAAPLRLAIVASVLVASLTFVVLPHLSRRLHRWLS